MSFSRCRRTSCAGLGPQPQEGRLLGIDDGRTYSVADVATADLKWESIPANKALNPQFPDANPYGVTVTREHQTYVVDAAANTVDRIGPHGAVKVIAYLPNTPQSDAVPTCLSQGPDGALYVGTLSIADGPGAAHVYRVDPRSHASVTTKATVWASGLSAINGCSFSRDGKYFYASEFIAMEKITGPVAGPPPAAVVKIPFNNPSSHTYLGLGCTALRRRSRGRRQRIGLRHQLEQPARRTRNGTGRPAEPLNTEPERAARCEETHPHRPLVSDESLARIIPIAPGGIRDGAPLAGAGKSTTGPMQLAQRHAIAAGTTPWPSSERLSGL